MVFFDTKFFKIGRFLYLYIQNRIKMSGIKYSLRQESTSFSIGTTNLRSSNGSLIDTNGCVALLVLSGFAVATINFEKRILRKGDFVLLFMIVLFLCYLFRLLFLFDMYRLHIIS